MKSFYSFIVLGIFFSVHSSPAITESKVSKPQNGSTKESKTGASGKRLPIRPRDWRVAPAWDWTTAKWTGKDRPFGLVRADIDKAFAQRRATLQWLKQLRSTASRKPKDAIAQFRYAYASFLFAYKGMRLPDENQTLLSIMRSLASAPSPHSYEYDRVRFLVTSRWGWEFAPQLKTMGVRLLKKNRKDFPVKNYLVRLLNWGSEKERQKALVLAQENVRDYPKEPNAHRALASVYKEMFGRGDSKAGDLAIASYKKFISLLPDTPSAENPRRDAQSLIDLIRKFQKKRRKPKR